MKYVSIRSLAAPSLVLLLVLLVIETAGVSAQVPLPPSIAYPITGNLVYIPPVLAVGDVPRAILLDTMSGDLDVLLSMNDVSDLMSNPLFNSTWEKVAYQVGTNLTAVQTVSDKSMTIYPNAGLVLSRPVGWLNNDEQLLLLSDVSGFSTPYQYELQVATVATGEFTTVLQMTATHDVTAIFPSLSPDLHDVQLADVKQAYGNPAYEAWVALQLDVILTDESYSSIAILYNYLTQETLNINGIINDVSFGIAPWSADGRFLAAEGDRHQSILRFDPSTTPSLTLYAQAPSARFTTGQQIEGFLGVQDLLLLSRSADTEYIFEVGQIHSDELFSTEFLTFERPETLVGISHSWHLTAGTPEQQALSCLFDRTLPSRLVVGGRAQVLPSGSTRPLHIEPDLHSTILASVSPATQFSVIASAECSGGFRWWQVQLDDQTTGFIAEASETEYFVEPYTVVPPTAVPTTAIPPTAVPTTAVPPTAVPTTAVPTSTPPVPGAGWLIFVSQRPVVTGGPNVWNIYAVSDDGDLQRLTDNTDPSTTGRLEQPVWSPTYQEIAYSETTGVDTNLCILTVTSRNTVCTFAINAQYPNSQPAWSPDGLWLAFVSPGTDGKDDVRKITVADLKNGTGGRGTNLTSGVNGDNTQPDWHPSLGWIVFSSNRVTTGNPEGNAEIFIMQSSSGSNVQQLTVTGANVDNNLPAFKPNGQRIAYNSDYIQDAKHDVVHRKLKLTGTTWSWDSDLVNLTQNRTGSYRFTTWKKSDEGENVIAVVRGDADDRQIFVVTVSPVAFVQPSWNSAQADDDPDW